MHPHVQDPQHIKGVRTVATIEFTKGVIVVLAGLGVFSMRHKDIWGVAESLLEFLQRSRANSNRKAQKACWNFSMPTRITTT